MNRRTALLTLGGIGAVALPPAPDPLRASFLPSDEEFHDINKFIGVWWDAFSDDPVLHSEQSLRYEQDMRACLLRELVAQNVVMLDRPAYLGFSRRDRHRARMLEPVPTGILLGQVPPGAPTIGEIMGSLLRTYQSQDPNGICWMFHRTGAPYDSGLTYGANWHCT